MILTVSYASFHLEYKVKNTKHKHLIEQTQTLITTA